MIRAAVNGRLGADPVNRATTRGGDPMWTASLAVAVARDGAEEAMEWIGLVAFGRPGVEFAQLRKAIRLPRWAAYTGAIFAAATASSVHRGR